LLQASVTHRTPQSQSSSPVPLSADQPALWSTLKGSLRPQFCHAKLLLTYCKIFFKLTYLSPVAPQLLELREQSPIFMMMQENLIRAVVEIWKFNTLHTNDAASSFGCLHDKYNSGGRCTVKACCSWKCDGICLIFDSVTYPWHK